MEVVLARVVALREVDTSLKSATVLLRETARAGGGGARGNGEQPKREAVVDLRAKPSPTLRIEGEGTFDCAVVPPPDYHDQLFVVAHVAITYAPRAARGGGGRFTSTPDSRALV